MTAVAAALPFAIQWAGAVPSVQGQSALCCVRLIDRRTGAAHRINGTALALYTRSPVEAVAELIAGRDPAVWEARIELLEPEGLK